MAKFFYTTALSEEKIDPTEVNQRFTDYANKVNTAKLDNDQFVVSAGRYRHLTEPQTIFLRNAQSGAAIGGGGGLTLATKNGSAYNELAGMRLTYSPSLDYRGTVNDRYPIGYIACEYESVLFQAHNYTLAILYSVNGGAAWSVYPNTERRFGRLNTHDTVALSIANPLWSELQEHPFTRVANTYRPNSSYNYRTLLTVGSLIGDNTAAHGSLGQIANITHFSVGIRCGDITVAAGAGNATKDMHTFDYCSLWLVAEDKGA